MTVPHVPDGLTAVTPYLIVDDASKLMEFLTAAFDGEVLYRHDDEGRVAHAKVRIADAVVEMSDAHAEWTPVSAAMHLYVPDADATFAAAMAAGATELYPMTDMPYGERSGGIKDPCGQSWYIATRTE